MKKKLFFFLLAAACESKEQKLALRNVNSPAARERTAAVRGLDPNDDAGYSALAKAVHDGSAPVRVEAAAALARSKRAEATDALAQLLRDPDDPVRIAAAQALGKRCGERGEAYLRMAFARSGAAVRAEIAQALQACGKPPQDTLAREEADRRRKAMKLLDDPAAAQRARGARELGLICRDQDQAPLLKLLDDSDGVAVAAAERALGDCGVAAAVPRIVKLLDEGGEVGAAGAEALAVLHKADQARPQLRKLALSDGDEAAPAAAALGQDCDAGPRAPRLEAAATLLAGCPRLEKVVVKRLQAGEVDPLLAELALQNRVAGPALVAALQRELARRPAERPKRAEENDSAAEIARSTPAGKDKYSRLMTRLQEREAAAQTRTAATSRFESLLHPDDRRDFIAAALRAALQLHAPGAEKVAAGFAHDLDPDIAAAARGEPPKAPPPKRVETLDARVALWSDDGAVRAQACPAADPAMRQALAAADPERRVRLACAAANETAPRK